MQKLFPFTLAFFHTFLAYCPASYPAKKIARPKAQPRTTAQAKTTARAATPLIIQPAGTRRHIIIFAAKTRALFTKLLFRHRLMTFRQEKIACIFTAVVV